MFSVVSLASCVYLDARESLARGDRNDVLVNQKDDGIHHVSQRARIDSGLGVNEQTVMRVSVGAAPMAMFTHLPYADDE